MGLLASPQSRGKILCASLFVFSLRAVVKPGFVFPVFSAKSSSLADSSRCDQGPVRASLFIGSVAI
jgi:hypothetical protein